MKYGLTAWQWNQLNDGLLKHLKKQNLKVYLFGSRAKGKFHPYSDIDLLVDDLQNQPTDRSQISLAMDAMENSNFPFKIELVYRSHLADSYREDVEASMVEI